MHFCEKTISTIGEETMGYIISVGLDNNECNSVNTSIPYLQILTPKLL